MIIIEPYKDGATIYVGEVECVAYIPGKPEYVCEQILKRVCRRAGQKDQVQLIDIILLNVNDVVYLYEDCLKNCGLYFEVERPADISLLLPVLGE